jgi:putative transposase
MGGNGYRVRGGWDTHDSIGQCAVFRRLSSRSESGKKPAARGDFPNCGCPGFSRFLGKTYVSDFLREFKQWRAAPKRHEHSIDNACALNRVRAIDLTQHRIEPQTQQPLLGILDHGSRRMLTLHALRARSSIAILRLLLNAIEHYGKPKAVRTDNEAIFTSWVFAFALQWLGISHQRTLLYCPWMNGRLERVWSTFKQVIRVCRIPDDIALQATLNLLREVYNQQRPHQSLNGYTPDEAWRILIEKKRKPKPHDQTRRR